MAVLPIRKFGDPVLKQRVRPVERVTEVHRRLIADMMETMRAAPGVGLAAPQVGVLERVFVWEVEDRHGAVINPRIVFQSQETDEEEEGCLSLPGLVYPVRRAVEVHIEGLDAAGDILTLEGRDLLARVFQHEIDHLDGVLFVDRLPEALRREAMKRLREQVLAGTSGSAETAEVVPKSGL